jgi:hypothetical protein
MPLTASGWAFEPLREIFAQVAVPVADRLTRSAFLGPWRLMSIDGFEWDAPDMPGNAAAFGYASSGATGNGQLKTRLRGPGGCCGPAARTWSARRSAATCWLTMRSARAVKRARHDSYRVKRASDKGTRRTGSPTIKLVNLRIYRLAA